MCMHIGMICKLQRHSPENVKYMTIWAHLLADLTCSVSFLIAPSLHTFTMSILQNAKDRAHQGYINKQVKTSQSLKGSVYQNSEPKYA